MPCREAGIGGKGLAGSRVAEKGFLRCTGFLGDFYGC
jgi:hypothetical protein